MILSKKYIPLWLRYVLLNLAAVMLLLFKGQFRPDWQSVVGIIVAFSGMNFVAWLSSRNYEDWK